MIGAAALAAREDREIGSCHRAVAESTLIDSANLFRLVQLFDVLAAVVFAAGTAKALDVAAPALVAIAMGAVTGAVGGIIRDTLGQVPSILLRHEIYVTASVLGACTYVGLNSLGLDRLAAMIAGFLVTFSVRGLAIRFGWSLPVFRESTNREPWNHDRRTPP